MNQQRQGGDSGGSQQQIMQPHLMDEMAAKLRQAEDEREQLRGIAKSRDIEIERMLNQKVALISIFESDLLSMSDKVINTSIKKGVNQDVVVQDLLNLQKLISVSFQALKSSMNGSNNSSRVI